MSASSAAELSAAVQAATPAETDIPPQGVEACGVRHVPAEELRRWKADPAFAQAQLQSIDDQTQRIAGAAVTRLAARLAAGNARQQVAARLLMQDREGAALLAERSSDALAYQLALQACVVGHEGAPGCARLNARRWAELDATDAWPWLRLAEEARRRKDAAGVDAALAQAAARPRLSRGAWLLEAQAVEAAEAVPDAAEFGQALLVVSGIDAAMAAWGDVPWQACKEEGPRETARQSHCRAVARQMLAGTSDLTEASLAQALSDRLGVPREQQAHDGATLKAAQERYFQRTLEDIGPDCAAMRRLKQWSAQRAASGELGMALALLKPR